MPIPRSSDAVPLSHSTRQLIALIRATKNGDANSMDLLFQRYRPYLRVLCSLELPRLCQKREDESDIVQNTLLDATRGFPDFRGETEAEFAVWMSRLLERNILQSVRRNVTGKRDIRREIADQNPDDSATLVWHADTNQSSVGTSLFRGESALQLAYALEKLPDDQRLAVELRYLGQQSIREIAKYMGKTTGTVAGLVRRGVVNLKDLVPAELGEIA